MSLAFRLGRLGVVSTRFVQPNQRLFSALALRHTGHYPKQNAFITRSYFWYPTPSTEPAKGPSPIPAADEVAPLNASVEPELQDAPSVALEEAPITSELASQASVDLVIPPLHYGDLAELGLISWTPAGFVRWTIELIQVTTGLPWFYTLVATTFLFRLCLLPLSISSLRNSARILPLTPRLTALKAEMQAASKSGDGLAMQRAALKQKKIYADAGVNMGPMMLNPLIQLPVTLGLFFGVKKMCTLPVLQLTQSGLDMLPNLTVPDPLFVLPVLATALINLQISLGSKEMNLADKPEMGHTMNFMRILTIVTIPFVGTLPSGVLVTLIAGVASTAMQTAAMQYKPLRRALNIPTIPPAMRGRLPTFKESFKAMVNWFGNQKLEAQTRRPSLRKK